MQLIRTFNKGICFLLCVIDIFRRYTWIIPIKDKNDIKSTNAVQKTEKNIFQKNESNRKPKKSRVNKGSKFCHRLMKSWLGKMT